MAKEKQRATKIKDIVHVMLIGVYLVQKLKKPTIEEVRTTAKEKLRALIDVRTLKRAMEGAAKAGFIAIHQVPVESGRTETAYTMKNLQFKNPPEYAVVDDLLPILLATDQAQAIKNWFDSQEGEGESKQSKKNIIREYQVLEWTCRSTDILLGSQPQCEYSEEIRRRFPNNIQKDNVEIDVFWERDFYTGAYVITQDVLQGWFASNALRYADLPEARAGYIAFAPIRIQPKGRIYQKTLPVQNQKQGQSKPQKYETLLPGQDFVIRAFAPIRGVAPIEEYERIIFLAGIRPKRGISPGRGRRYGRFLVTQFNNLGPLSKQADLHCIENDIPDEFFENDEIGNYYRDAINRFGPAKTASKYDPGDFPGSEIPSEDT